MNTRRAWDRPGITIRAISNHAIESIMGASLALVRCKVRIVDHLFFFISLKKHASPASAANPHRQQQAFQALFSLSSVALGGERVGQGTVEGGHSSASLLSATISADDNRGIDAWRQRSGRAGERRLGRPRQAPWVSIIHWPSRTVPRE